MSARHEQSRYRFGGAFIITAVGIILSALLIWTLAHTDIVAFATLFFVALVLVSGTFLLTRSEPNSTSDWYWIRRPELSKSVHHDS